VQGAFPLVFTKAGGRIEHGALTAAPGGGVIKYAGDVRPAGVAALAFDALKSFRYDALALELNGDLAGDVVTEIRFSGANQSPVKPAGSFFSAKGIPFKFNVSVKAPFVALAKTAATVGDARTLLRQAEPAPAETTAPPTPPTPPPS
jgi:translocation and assembly module TamB